jgi:predicted alpha/beta superfamily hydrolase
LINTKSYSRKLAVLILVIFFVSMKAAVTAQNNLRLVISNSGKNHIGDSVFVAGNFNDWNPGNPTYQLKSKKDQLYIDIPNLPSGKYEFKFTRGAWNKVAVTKSGADISNYTILLSSDTLLNYTIQGWKDDFSVAAKDHTASPNVSILDTAFYMPQLNRHRRIAIYLPEGYFKSAKRYPVLYMHDGQNLFDDFTAGFGEWGIDESLDSLIKKGKKGCIVVGIDNGPKRLNEYNPYAFEQFGKGEGDAYVNFIVETLKPYIDRQFRTMPNKENTIIAGSSMGGLISYYAMLKHPGVFGKAGVFSPAFWTADEIKQLTDSVGKSVKGLLFFYMGGMEGEKYLADMINISERLAKVSTTYIYTAIDAEGEHNEMAWKKWFADFYEWISADGYNYIIKVVN